MQFVKNEQPFANAADGSIRTGISRIREKNPQREVKESGAAMTSEGVTCWKPDDVTAAIAIPRPINSSSLIID